MTLHTCEIRLTRDDHPDTTSVITERDEPLEALVDAAVTALSPHRRQLRRHALELQQRLGLEPPELERIRRELARLTDYLLRSHPSEAVDVAAAALAGNHLDGWAVAAGVLVDEVLRLIPRTGEPELRQIELDPADPLGVTVG